MTDSLTSSIKISGFSVFVFFKHCITLPGMAPTYVLLYAASKHRILETTLADEYGNNAKCPIS